MDNVPMMLTAIFADPDDVGAWSAAVDCVMEEKGYCREYAESWVRSTVRVRQEAHAIQTAAALTARDHPDHYLVRRLIIDALPRGLVVPEQIHIVGGDVPPRLQEYPSPTAEGGLGVALVVSAWWLVRNVASTKKAREQRKAKH